MSKVLLVAGELLELLALAVLTVAVLGALGATAPPPRCSAPPATAAVAR